MAAALPVTKLAGLLIKTLAKPLSKRIKHEFSRYRTTQRILIGIGQTSHQVTSRLTIWSAGYQVRSIKALEEEKARKDGAEFLGETFLLFVSGGWLLYEYNNSAEKSRIKEEKQRKQAKGERDALQAQLHAITDRIDALETVVKDHHRRSWTLLQQRNELGKGPAPDSGQDTGGASGDGKAKGEAAGRAPAGEKESGSDGVPSVGQSAPTSWWRRFLP